MPVPKVLCELMDDMHAQCATLIQWSVHLGVTRIVKPQTRILM